MDTAVRFPFASLFPGVRHGERTLVDLLASPAVDAAAADSARLGELADPAAARLFLYASAPRRFFDGAGDAAVPALLGDRFPEHRRRVVTVADVLTQQAPVDRGSAPALLGEDPALTWEPRRHQWIVRIAQAYSLTGEWRYAEACVAAIDAWLDGSDASSDADFARSAEVAGRLMSWCWVLMLIREAPGVGGEWIARVLAALRQQAVHVSRALSLHSPPPTHATGNALALLYAGTLLRELPESARWRQTATRALVAQSEGQICTDGVHFEQSTCFHAFTVDVYLQFLLLAGRNGIDVPPAVARRVERMMDFLLAIRRPDGSIPAIGDNDGGSLLPLTVRPALDSGGRFAVAAALFRRADFAWGAEGLTPEVAWLMGTDGVRAFDALEPAPPASGASRIFPSGGYAVLRTGWEPDAHQMIVDVGPLGCPVSGGHGHADLLSLQCVVFGESCIEDPGTHCYGGDSKWRDFFRSTAAHSTVVVDGVSQAESTGPFGWRRQPRVRLREWHSTPEFDFVDAEHDGYHSLPDPVGHRRRVIFVKPGYWIVVDDLTGRGRHQLDLTFQFAACDVRLEAHPWARAATPAGPVLWISPFPSAPAQPALKCGEPSPIRGWISPEIACLSPAPMLIYSFAVALPWRIVTLLLPDRQALATPPAVRPLYDDGGLPHGFVFERPRRVVRFDDHAVLVERD
jgi:uncharacterized heparinase superfamily protein